MKMNTKNDSSRISRVALFIVLLFPFLSQAANHAYILTASGNISSDPYYNHTYTYGGAVLSYAAGSSFTTLMTSELSCSNSSSLGSTFSVNGWPAGGPASPSISYRQCIGGANDGNVYIVLNLTSLGTCGSVSIDYPSLTYATGSCAPPAECGYEAGDTLTVSSASATCVEECAINNVMGFPTEGIYFGTVTGDACETTDATLIEENTPDSDGCMVINDRRMCPIPDSENLETYSMDGSVIPLETEVLEIPKGTCVYSHGGQLYCNGVTTSPPAPDTGTPGTPATPTEYNYPSGTSVDIYDPNQVAGSSITPGGASGGVTGGFDSITDKLQELIDGVTGDAGTGETQPTFDEGTGGDDMAALGTDIDESEAFESPATTGSVASVFSALNTVGCSPWTVGTLLGNSFVIDLCAYSAGIQSVMAFLFIGLFLIGVWEAYRSI